MRRTFALVMIGLVAVGLAGFWFYLPTLTESTETVVSQTTSPTPVSSGSDQASVQPGDESASTIPSVTGLPIGGIASAGIVGEPLSLNPLLAGGNSPAVETIAELWTVGLIELDPISLDPLPSAAVEIPTTENGGLVLNEDGSLTVRFDLDPDVRWENGDVVTGFDVAFTYDLIVDASLPIRPDIRALHSLIVPGSVEPSTRSVTMVLERPTVRYLSLFPILVPISQVENTDFANDWNETTWMSAGPFSFGSWEAGVDVRLSRNDSYYRLDEHGDPLPYLDGVRVAFFNTDAELLAAFRLQEVDSAPIAPDPVLLAEFDASPAVVLQVAEGPEYEHVAFQFGPGRFEANPVSMNESIEFREFIARSIEREAVVGEVFADRISVLDTVVGTSWPLASSDGWSVYSADPTTQQNLLAVAMGQFERETASVDFTTSASLERTQIAGAFLQNLAGAGLSVDIELLEVGEFFRDRVLPGTFDIGEWAWRSSPGPVGAVSDLEDRFLTLPENDGYNFYRWGAGDAVSPQIASEIQSRIEALDATLDLEDLRLKLRAIDALLAEHVVVIPMYATPNAAAAWTTSFTGFNHVASYPDTWNAAFWHRIGA